MAARTLPLRCIYQDCLAVQELNISYHIWGNRVNHYVYIYTPIIVTEFMFLNSNPIVLILSFWVLQEGGLLGILGRLTVGVPREYVRPCNGSMRYMSYSLNSSRLIKGDTRSLDYSSYVEKLANHLRQ